MLKIVTVFLLVGVMAVPVAAQVLTESQELEVAGDSLASTARDLDGQVAAAIVWENAWNCPNPSPTLPLKLARVYGALLRLPEASPSLLIYATNACLRLPSNISGSPQDIQEYAFARSCALFHARCYPELIETLKAAGDDTEVQGIRGVLSVLGTDSFVITSGPRNFADGRKVTIWKSLGLPAAESVSCLELSVIVDSQQGPCSFSLSRFLIEDKPQYYFFANHPDGEELLHAYGEEMPSFEVLYAMVSRELARRQSAAPEVR